MGKKDDRKSAKEPKEKKESKKEMKARLAAEAKEEERLEMERIKAEKEAEKQAGYLKKLEDLQATVIEKKEAVDKFDGVSVRPYPEGKDDPCRDADTKLMKEAAGECEDANNAMSNVLKLVSDENAKAPLQAILDASVAGVEDVIKRADAIEKMLLDEKMAIAAAEKELARKTQYMKDVCTKVPLDVGVKEMNECIAECTEGGVEKAVIDVCKAKLKELKTFMGDLMVASEALEKAVANGLTNTPALEDELGAAIKGIAARINREVDLKRVRICAAAKETEVPVDELKTQIDLAMEHGIDPENEMLKWAVDKADKAGKAQQDAIDKAKKAKKPLPPVPEVPVYPKHCTDVNDEVEKVIKLVDDGHKELRKARAIKALAAASEEEKITEEALLDLGERGKDDTHPVVKTLELAYNEACEANCAAEVQAEGKASFDKAVANRIAARAGKLTAQLEKLNEPTELAPVAQLPIDGYLNIPALQEKLDEAIGEGTLSAETIKTMTDRIFNAHKELAERVLNPIILVDPVNNVDLIQPLREGIIEGELRKVPEDMIVKAKTKLKFLEEVRDRRIKAHNALLAVLQVDSLLSCYYPPSADPQSIEFAPVQAAIDEAKAAELFIPVYTTALPVGDPASAEKEAQLKEEIAKIPEDKKEEKKDDLAKLEAELKEVAGKYIPAPEPLIGLEKVVVNAEMRLAALKLEQRLFKMITGVAPDKIDISELRELLSEIGTAELKAQTENLRQKQQARDELFARVATLEETQSLQGSRDSFLTNQKRTSVKKMIHEDFNKEPEPHQFEGRVSVVIRTVEVEPVTSSGVNEVQRQELDRLRRDLNRAEDELTEAKDTLEDLHQRVGVAQELIAEGKAKLLAAEQIIELVEAAKPGPLQIDVNFLQERIAVAEAAKVPKNYIDDARKKLKQVHEYVRKRIRVIESLRIKVEETPGPDEREVGRLINSLIKLIKDAEETCVDEKEVVKAEDRLVTLAIYIERLVEARGAQDKEGCAVM